MSDILKNLLIAPVASADKLILSRMMQLYLHDFSEFANVGEPYGEIGDDAVFYYPHFDRNWSEKGREPLLIKVAGHIAGFALINQWSPSGLAV